MLHLTCNQSQSHITNIRQQVFKLLDKDPLLTASTISKILKLTKEETQYYKGYLRKLKYDWKNNHQKQLGSIRSKPDEVHRAFFVGKSALYMRFDNTLREIIMNGYDAFISPENGDNSFIDILK